jgi:hypothetical protein
MMPVLLYVKFKDISELLLELIVEIGLRKTGDVKCFILVM